MEMLSCFRKEQKVVYADEATLNQENFGETELA